MDIPHLVYTFTGGRTFGSFPVWGDDKWSYHKYLCPSVCMGISFLFCRVDPQAGECWVDPLHVDLPPT